MQATYVSNSMQHEVYPASSPRIWLLEGQDGAGVEVFVPDMHSHCLFGPHFLEL